MSTNLKKQIRISFRWSSLIIFIQWTACSTVFANKTTGQGLADTYVSVEWEEIKLIKGLSDLEQKTIFSFFYKDADMKKLGPITLKVKNRSLKDVLTILSKENNLRFKRLNNVISVIPKRDGSELIIEEQDMDRTISGKVTDETGEGIPGVNILIKGTNLGVISDVDGNYSIAVPDGNKVLVFSFIGFETREISMNSESVINVTMYPDSRELEEVVVVGYGSQNKREVAGSISSVKFDQVENTPIQSFDKVLQGRSPGVQITNGGAPGGATQVRVRGIGSINSGNEPLFIIDGLQVVQGAWGEAGGGQENVLASINPNDIVSVDILKDAAASIYGAQAANGVIIITTKRGQAGKTQFNLNSHWGVSQVINRLDLLNGPEWTGLVLEGYANRYGIESEEYLRQLEFLGNPEDAPTYDWQKLLFQNGFIQNYELSARGGSETSSFYVSGSYNDTEGHVIGTGFQRGTLRANLDNTFSKRITSSLSTNLSITNTDVTRGDGFWFNNPTTASAFIIPTNAPYEEDGSIREPLTGLYSENPLVNEHPDLFDETTTNYKALISLALEYRMTDDLTLKSGWGVDYLSNNYFSFASPEALVSGGNGGGIYESNTRSMNWQMDQTLHYDKKIGKHRLGGLVGINYRQQTINYFFASGENLVSPNLNALGTASIFDAGGSTSEWKLAGIFGRMNYTFNDKYIFSGTLRRDGSSRFGKDNQWGLFPAASVAWRLGDEGFMAILSNTVNDLKLRGSYGVTGNANIDNFASRGLFMGNISFLGNGGAAPETVSNEELSWEQSETINVGLDAAFFDSRIRITTDYFIRTTKDLLFETPVPTTTGYTSVWQNVGEVENKGFELDIQSVNVTVGQFQWTSGFNITKVSNEILALSGETDRIINGTVINAVGSSIESWYAIRYAGVNPADGRPMYLNREGELTFHPTDDDRVIVASSLPTFYGGLTNDFTYKGLTLSVLFQYSGGNYLRNGLAFSTKASGGFADRNQQRSELRRWQKPGDITDVPIAYNGFAYDAMAGNSYSSRHIEKGDYVRLKQVNLSYSLPPKLLSKFNLRSLTVYTSGNNLWTRTAYTGRDPEILGADETGDYPQSKSYVVGINLGF